MNKQGCLICGKPLVYLEQEKTMECAICHQSFLSNACCEDGHFICDNCHEKRGIEEILAYCSTTDSKNPIEIAMALMDSPWLYMHGPEHHVLVGAALLTAYHNAGGSLDLPHALEEMAQRGQKVPGGICGFWGCCGAAVSCGIYLSILTQSTPLSEESWGLCNQTTSAALEAIGSFGGPRCCKRDSFTAIKTAVARTKELFGIEMELPQPIVCHYSAYNPQCLGKRCPYNRYHTMVKKG